jgi:hypothetical protein
VEEEAIGEGRKEREKSEGEMKTKPCQPKSVSFSPVRSF